MPAISAVMLGRPSNPGRARSGPDRRSGWLIAATRGPGRGVGDVWSRRIDQPGPFALTATRNAYRRVVAVESFTTEAVHAVGLAAHGGPIPRIDLDGVVVLRLGDAHATDRRRRRGRLRIGRRRADRSLAGNLPGPIALLGDLAYPTGSAADFE